jgi:hypothetical protein
MFDFAAHLRALRDDKSPNLVASGEYDGGNATSVATWEAFKAWLHAGE